MLAECTRSSATAEIARVVLVTHKLATADGQVKRADKRETVKECDHKTLLKSIHCDVGACCGHFRSREKNGGHTAKSATVENPILSKHRSDRGF